MRVPSATAGRSDGRVSLRPYRVDDLDELFAAVRESLNALMPWMPWAHAGYTRAESAEWLGQRDAAWESGSDFAFAVLGARDGDLLGGCGVNQINPMHGYANLGYWVRSSRAGHGIATAAARLAARFGLEEAGLERLEIAVPVSNAPSLRVAEKLGAVREGVLRRRLRLSTGMSDAVMYSLTRAELRGGASGVASANGARRV